MNKICINVVKGNILNFAAEGIVVPQFSNKMSLTGVAGVLARTGHYCGIWDYATAARLMRIPYGYVLTTQGMKGIKILNVSLLGVAEADAFNMVQLAMFSVLAEAEKQGLSSIVMPALGTGKSGNLSFKLSAKAMLSAAQTYQKQATGCLKTVQVCLFKSDYAYNTYQQVAEKECFGIHPNPELQTWHEANRRNMMRKNRIG